MKCTSLLYRECMKQFSHLHSWNITDPFPYCFKVAWGLCIHSIAACVCWNQTQLIWAKAEKLCTAWAKASCSPYQHQLAIAREGLIGGLAAGIVGDTRPGRWRAVRDLAARLASALLYWPLHFSGEILCQLFGTHWVVYTFWQSNSDIAGDTWPGRWRAVWDLAARLAGVLLHCPPSGTCIKRGKERLGQGHALTPASQR